MEPRSRRRFLASAGLFGMAGLAGCLGDTAEAGGIGAPELPIVNSDDGSDEPMQERGPPVVDRSLPEDYSIAELNENAMSGGPPPDGIPSIDDPQFVPAEEAAATLVDEFPVFGVDIDGDVRAYPQYILVWHEIVNDVVGGESVAVTYCPLTGTAQGFVRGDVTFGVSGSLINTNLVMFDRTTDSWWPQILARGIRGPHEGDYLEEFQVIWTTWERWRTAYPETLVLSEETGFARNYGGDPYGSYFDGSGYYTNDNTLFPPLQTDDRFHLKDVVIGARTADGAMAVPKASLRDESVITGSVGDVPYVSVYDPPLDTGYVYRNPDDTDVIAADDGYRVDGTTYAAADLPLDRVIAFDAMWLAWYGYYPSTVVHQ